MLGRVIVAALCALLCTARATAMTVDDLPADAAYTIKTIRVDGNHSLSDRAIRGVMLLKVPPFWKPWQAHPQFNADLFRTDLARIQTLLRESGHFKAQVGYDLEVDGDELTIILHVEDRPPARVTEVAIAPADFTLTPAEESALRALLTLEAADVFTQDAYDQSRAKLERYYLERGYAYVAVAKAAVVDTGTDSARVTYAITRGPAAVFGQTTITGTQTVADRLVRREITYEEGQPYDARKVEETQANVFGLRLFRSVAVKAANLADRSGVVDMLINVTEGLPREVKIGVGYGLEDGPRGQIRWQHNNFFGGGRQLAFQLKGSTIEQAVRGEFRQPHFLALQQSLVVPLTQAREDEPAFTNQSIRLSPRIERKFAPQHLRASLGYNIEYDDLTKVPSSTAERLDEFRSSGFLSSITAVVERNTTIDLLDPHEGTVVNLTAEQAGGPLQGDFSFYRAVLEAKGYLPVFGERVIAGRARIGGGDAFGGSRDIPLFRRFYAGGINSTRGYERDLIGPLNASDDPVGGRSLLEGSLEFRTPVYKQIGAVAFVDVGEVRRKPWSYSAEDLQFGVGAGVRYDTIVGPLRLDLGFPLQRPPGQSSWQIHLSIGQAF
jgi:outer membrane protein assembly complex protein YaeT